MQTPLLNNIRKPADVKRLPKEKLPQLAAEMRALMIETTAQNGGHLSSSLGVVELTIMLHRIFGCPNDAIVWDVGHQSYPHKLLTGRRAVFDTLRTQNGLSGFPKSAESPCDAFVAGHSSTSISAALGIAVAKKQAGKKDKTIAVIGDGALTGGLAYEGLNNAGRSGTNLLVILNDNEMSISKNVGAMAKYLAVVRTKPGYYRFKDFVDNTVSKTPVIGQGMRKAIVASKTRLKDALYPSTFFEDMGFFYLGPVDGHNFEQLESVLRRAKQIEQPVFLHIQTKKGKGYPFAERNPGGFHGVSSFEPKTGALPPAKPNFSQVVGQALCHLAEANPNLVAVTAAMKEGTGLSTFAKKYPARFFDVGIAEGHAVTFCGGMAAGGLVPVFAVYSTFLQRAYDQLLHDLSIENRHVVLAIDRAGLVGEDGETHQGLFDVAFLRTLPGVTIDAPQTFAEAAFCLERLVAGQGVCALRYPRGGELAGTTREQTCLADFDHRTFGGRILLVSYGRISANLFAARDALQAKGICCDLLKLVRICPLPQQALQICLGYDRVIFFEEGTPNGSVGESLQRQLAQLGFGGRFDFRGVEGFVAQGSTAEQLTRFGLDVQGMIDFVEQDR